jgi:hypothetical protein
MAGSSKKSPTKIEKDRRIAARAWTDDKLIINTYRENAKSTARLVSTIMQECCLSEDSIKCTSPKIARLIYELNRREFSFVSLVNRTWIGVSGVLAICTLMIGLLFSDRLGDGLLSRALIILLELFSILSIVGIILWIAFRYTISSIQISFWPLIIFGGVWAVLWIPAFTYLTGFSLRALEEITLIVILFAIWISIGVWAAIRITRRIIATFGPATRWPELAVIRSLSDALCTAAGNIPDGRPSYDAGKTAVRRVSAAANMFELMIHQLAEADHAAAESLRSMLGAAAATLRSCLPALAAPTGATLRPCIRLLSEALAGMAIRDFSWVDKNLVQAAPATAASWRDRLQGFIRWLALAVAPAVAVVVAIRWALLPDSTTQSLAIQIAVLCFVYGSFSSFGQVGRDQFKDVIDSGATLFGWNKKP